MVHSANWVHTSLYLQSETFTSLYQYVLGMYLVCTWYVVVRTWEKKNEHNTGIRPVDLMHSILRATPLRCERSFNGDITG